MESNEWMCLITAGFLKMTFLILFEFQDSPTLDERQHKSILRKQHLLFISARSALSIVASSELRQLILKSISLFNFNMHHNYARLSPASGMSSVTSASLNTFCSSSVLLVSGHGWGWGMRVLNHWILSSPWQCLPHHHILLCHLWCLTQHYPQSQHHLYLLLFAVTEEWSQWTWTRESWRQWHRPQTRLSQRWYQQQRYFWRPVWHGGRWDSAQDWHQIRSSAQSSSS